MFVVCCVMIVVLVFVVCCWLLADLGLLFVGGNACCLLFDVCL